MVTRNAFQSIIERTASRSERELAQLSFFLADLWQSIDAARLTDQYDPARSQALDLVKEDIRDAVDQVNRLRGFSDIPRGDKKPKP